ncbi:MATE family efflux transporter [Clostridium sp. 'deep sea']|uniref:MATE family efflux transporter n=1 Tax=Clostridium sp. 'deep sea' TaxID=2779445 RepID=UPI0018969729|nr:MATE family efflux transporter [Clostridium sp. 'deep sea']QOR34827.1 MATE family efflux transporter [Clostridium sp. 'deep sea']
MRIVNSKTKIMGEAKVSTALLKFGLPATIGLLVTALYNFVDAIFVGGLGTSAMGAASISFPISMVIIGLGLTLGSGVASYISRLLGKKNIEQASKAASTAFFSSLLLGTIVIVPSIIFLEPLLKLFGATATILPYAKDYAYIFISGSILNVINVTMNNIIRAEGAAKTSMKALVLGSVLNIILDPIFIYTFNFGIKGAAIATVISQAASTLLLFKYFASPKSIVKISLKNFTATKIILGQILKVGTPDLVFQLLSSASMGLINTAAAPYGDAAVASMGIVNRIFAIGSFIIFGFFKGFQPLAGYNYGAKNYSRLKEIKNTALKWTTILCFLVALVQIVFAKQIVAMFSNDTQVIELGIKALRAYSIMFPLFGYQTLYKTLFLSMGKAKEGGILSISRQGIFFIPIVFLLPRLIGLNGIIFSQAIADLLTVIFTWLLSIKLNKYLTQQIEPSLTASSLD